MAELNDPRKMAKLVKLGYKKMSHFRKTRMKLLKEFVGPLYTDGNEGQCKRPINLIYQAATTLVPNLVYNSPKVQITSKFASYRPYCDVAELAVNHLIKEINLRMTMRKVITDAIFMAGFIKTGLSVSGQVIQEDNWLFDVGQPYADRIDPDDMLLDPMARQWEEQRIIGNRYRVDYQSLLESGLYDEDELKVAQSRYDAHKSEASTLSGESSMTEADDVFKTIDLVDVYVPDHQMIYTMCWGQDNEVHGKFLREIPYEGPESGPYNMLGFAFVPDNILPVPPCHMWYELHLQANEIARKIKNQASREKKILAYESDAWEDAQELVDSEDGDSIRVDSVDAVKELSLGGTSTDAYQYMEWAKQNYSEMAMNIDMLSGQGSDEPTATQAEIVNANTQIRLRDMQSMVYDFTAKTTENLFFYLHTDPLIDLPLVKRQHGQDVQVYYTPEMREGDWQDYYIEIRPFSMAHSDPNMETRRLMELFGNVMPALGNAYMMLGPMLNLENSLRIIATKMGIEELDEIVNIQAIQQQRALMQQLLDQGVPMDPKVIKTITGGMNAGGAALQPNQGNPNQMLKIGMTPQTERNMAQQETPAELQQVYTMQ